jgi:pescadillo protein
VSWEGVGDDSIGAGPYGADDKRITHHVIDRPSLASPRVDRSYVQPQWVYDCVNCRKVLPTAPYTVGAVLPPHLSPFGDEGQDADFVPPDPTTLADVEIAGDSDEEDEVEEDDDEDDEDEDEALYREELAAERADADADADADEGAAKPGKKAAASSAGKAKAKAKPKQTEEERLAAETKELAKSMMTKKEARCVVVVVVVVVVVRPFLRGFYYLHFFFFSFVPPHLSRPSLAV